VVEDSGAAAPGYIGAAAGVPVLFAARPAAVRLEDRWAAAWLEDQRGVPQCADREVQGPPSARVGVPQCAGREAPGPRWVRPEVQQCVDRWVAALRWGRPGVRQCGDRRAAAPR
jgi:hypothetical protein